MVQDRDAGVLRFNPEPIESDGVLIMAEVSALEAALRSFR